MPIQYQILCASKKTIKGQDTITQIGGRNPLGEVWVLKIDQVAAGIRSGQWEFFMNHRAVSFPIQLLESENGDTIGVFENSKNLLMELPDCPE